eukprot:3939743-Rhodomonas_salina.1
MLNTTRRNHMQVPRTGIIPHLVFADHVRVERHYAREWHPETVRYGIHAIGTAHGVRDPEPDAPPRLQIGVGEVRGAVPDLIGTRVGGRGVSELWVDAPEAEPRAAVHRGEGE